MTHRVPLPSTIRPKRVSSQQEAARNLLLTTLSAPAARPFNNPYFQQPKRKDNSQQLNFVRSRALLAAPVTTPTNRHIRTEYWPKKATRQPDQLPNLLLGTLGVPSAVPFANPYFTNPVRRVDMAHHAYVNLAYDQEGVPFLPVYDGYRPKTKEVRQPDPINNLLQTTLYTEPVVTLPEIRYEFEDYRKKPGIRIDSYPNLVLQIPVAASPIVPSQFQQPQKTTRTRLDDYPNLVLQVPVAASPIAPIDFINHAKRTSRIETTQQNLLLTTLMLESSPITAGWFDNQTKKRQPEISYYYQGLFQTTLYIAPPVPEIRLFDQPNPTKRGLSQQPYTWRSLNLTTLATFTVPDVVGTAQAVGTATLEAAGFVVSVASEYSQTVAVGDIVSQSPAGGSQAAFGSVVVITVSLGPSSGSIYPFIRRRGRR